MEKQLRNQNKEVLSHKKIIHGFEGPVSGLGVPRTQIMWNTQWRSRVKNREYD